MIKKPKVKEKIQNLSRIRNLDRENFYTNRASFISTMKRKAFLISTMKRKASLFNKKNILERISLSKIFLIIELLNY